MTYAEYQQAQRIARSEGLPIVAHRFSGAGEDYGTDARAYTPWSGTWKPGNA